MLSGHIDSVENGEVGLFNHILMHGIYWQLRLSKNISAARVLYKYIGIKGYPQIYLQLGLFTNISAARVVHKYIGS